MYTIRKEVGGICDEHNETAFDLWESPNKCVLKRQGCTDADDDPNQKTTEKHGQEYANGFKQRENCQVARGARISISLCCFEQHNGDGIVQDRLAKDDGIKLWLDFVDVEDGKDGDRVSCRESSTDREGFNETNPEAVQGYASPQVENEAEHDS